MVIGDIVIAVVFGSIVGVLGRLVVPGRRPAPLWLVVVAGVAAAIIGAWLGQVLFGWENGALSFPVVLLQIMLAAIGVFTAATLGLRRGGA
ncbi:hypothetical protein SAMN04489712_108144 [Thermomonospora echinospora]|uniref:Transglycosylase associated protein n=1 Tax=Thermomonospora echinospora TaxID=1992 RepID=A0A1H6BYT7_9ACTN|nr:GlsB/YeaQ/YmgE family stress response membrane protein [Thermomonospora echinospora]SEG65864.1 hypothetical protein SAMN04489712_108144 [Thermomonospora echinospora]